ncbi:MAG TPA: carotenoid biosynthesis protein [Verrucomicrobiae bacterium]|nr:carotenoid biosynthesis protein [Verrucomicrobiae bacterium]
MPEPRSQEVAGHVVVPPLAAIEPKACLSPTVEVWHRPVFIVFLVCWVVNWVVLLLRVDLAGQGRWIESLLPVTACATTLLALARRLPLQNVLMAGFLIGGLASIITAVAALSGVPVGPIYYTERMGERIAGVVPWPIPLLWVILIINGRGVARLIMRPWRRTNYYGYWVIGLTCLLAVWFDVGLEAFAVKVNNYWLWLGKQSVLRWQTAPYVNFLGWFVSALGMIAFTMPWLINKLPIKQPMDYHPLVVWLLLNGWVLTGNAMHGLGSAVALSLIGNTLAAVCAIRGARW